MSTEPITKPNQTKPKKPEHLQSSQAIRAQARVSKGATLMAHLAVEVRILSTVLPPSPTAPLNRDLPSQAFGYGTRTGSAQKTLD